MCVENCRKKTTRLDKNSPYRTVKKVFPQITWLLVLSISALGVFIILLFLPTLLELRKPKDLGPRKITETMKRTLTRRRRKPDNHAKLLSTITDHIPENLRHTLIDLDDKEISELGDDGIRIVGDVNLPPDIEIQENVVVEGSLTIGDRCHFLGSVKASEDVRVGNEVVIEENLIAGGNVNIGKDTMIYGSVNADGSVRLGQNSLVGLSITSGEDVELHENARVAKTITCGSHIRVVKFGMQEKDGDASV